MQRLTGCVCLHALSSFQRTDGWCVKDAPPGSPPLVGVTALPPFRTCPKGLAAWPFAARLGEPFKVTSRTTRCQPSFSAFSLPRLLAELAGTLRGKHQLNYLAGFRGPNVRKVSRTWRLWSST